MSLLVVVASLVCEGRAQADGGYTVYRPRQPDVRRPARYTTVTQAETRAIRPARDLGQENFVELDAQAGMFSGLRAKGFVHSGRIRRVSYNIALEAMAGASLFTQSLLPTTFGVGGRGEIYLWSGKRHAWVISPGADLYYVPSKASRPGNPAQDFGQSIAQAFPGGLIDVPTPVFVAAPSVDFNWLYQYNPHFSVVIGAKAGASIALGGTDSRGISIMGKTLPDFGLYVGTRF